MYVYVATKMKMKMTHNVREEQHSLVVISLPWYELNVINTVNMKMATEETVEVVAVETKPEEEVVSTTCQCPIYPLISHN